MAVNYNPSIVTNGLVFCLDAANPKSYPGSGTSWTDLSGLGNTGTLTNGPTYNSANGGSIVFDGTNDYVDCGNNTNSSLAGQRFTVEVWIRPTAYALGTGFNEGRSIIGKWNTETTEKGWRIDINTSNITWYTGSSIIHTTPITLNQWNHIVVSGDGSNSSFYKNSILVSGPSANVWTDSSSKNLLVGALRFGGYSYYYQGNISIAKIYKGKALTASEIQQNFNATRSRYGI